MSKRCEYGLRAALFLAGKAPGVYTQAREIAAAESLPAKFLESVLNAMRSANLLASKVGAGGGYRLAKPAEATFIDEIVLTFDRGRAPTVDRDSSFSQIAFSLAVERFDECMREHFGRCSLSDLLREANRRAEALAAMD